MWTYVDEPTRHGLDDIRNFVSDAVAEQDQGSGLLFAIVRQSDDRAVDGTSYIDIRPADRTLEIGWTWLRPSEWGTGTNTEVKYLLRHASQVLGAGRVAIKTDGRNARSRRVIEKLGATYEGTWRNHRLLSTGSYRHTDYFSVINSEWPAVRQRLDKDSPGTHAYGCNMTIALETSGFRGVHERPTVHQFACRLTCMARCCRHDSCVVPASAKKDSQHGDT